MPTAFTLRLTPIPAGSLLVFYGPSNPDYVVALNPTTGNAIGNLPLVGQLRRHGGGLRSNHRRDLPGRPQSQRRQPDRRNLRHDHHRTGAHTAGDEDPAHTFAAPFNLGDGAIALDPSGDGTLWLGSDQTGDIVHITNTGTILKTLSIFPQAPGNIGVSGMAFDASGNLLVATNQGVVLKLNVNFDAASFTPTPTLTVDHRHGDERHARPTRALPSADAGQVITLTGTNFTSSTEVVFQIRDGAGNTAQQAVAPNWRQRDGHHRCRCRCRRWRPPAPCRW